jgi:beta-glucanase (GH16 family)
MSDRARHIKLPALGILLLILAAACSPDRQALTAPEVPPASSAVAAPSAVTAAGGVCDFDPAENVLTGPGWTKVFEDGFSGDLSQWTIWTGGAFNEELQLYQPSNLATTNGLLSISARKETATGPTTPFDPTPRTFSWTSGRIESKSHFSASRTTPRVRLSARLKLPGGYGMWPAFWSYGDPWPTQGEIDVMEGRGQEPYQYQTAYWFGRRPGKNLVSNSATVVSSVVSLTDCWHVYEVIWSKNDLTFLFDGQVVNSRSGDYIPSMYGKKERITLNLAVGGLFFGSYDPAAIQPGTFQVDWVKAFTAR